MSVKSGANINVLNLWNSLVPATTTDYTYNGQLLQPTIGPIQRGSYQKYFKLDENILEYWDIDMQ